MCMLVAICMRVWVPTEVLEPTGAAVRSDCQSPDVGAENQT